MDLTVLGLIDSIKLDGTLPDGMFTDAEYTKFLNEGFYSEVLPFIMKHREDFYVTYTDFAPTDSIPIPSDAIGGKLQDILLVSGDLIVANVPRLSKEELVYNTQLGFYLEGNNIKFYPPNTLSQTVRVYYYERPLPLDAPDNIMQVTAWDEPTLTATVKLINNTATTIADWVDFPVDCGSTDNNQPYDYTARRIVGASEVLDTVEMFETGISVGEYIARENYRAIPKLPLEVREVLIQAAILKAMISIKDMDGVKLAGESLTMCKDSASTILTPRVDNEVKKIVNSRGIWGGSSNRNRR